MVRFRGQRGVEEKLIEASTDALAERVGRLVCARRSATFMLCQRAVIADESILAESATETDPEPPQLDKPSLHEQRERQKNRPAARGEA
jgi:hypothetical protein